MCLDWHWLPPLICVRSLGFVREVGPHLSLLKNNFKRHALHCEKKTRELTDPGGRSPRSGSYSAMFFMLLWIRPRI